MGYPFAGVMIFLGAFLFIIIFALGTDAILTLKNGVGWVWQDKNGTAISKFLEEKDGCISFLDVYGNQSKACGSYVIKRYK